MKTSASSAPEPSAAPAPQSRKPSANAGYDGRSTQTAKPAAVTSGARHSSSRRDTASAQAPEGTSSRMALADQMTKSEEICPTDSPASANSSTYTG